MFKILRINKEIFCKSKALLNSDQINNLNLGCPNASESLR